MKILVCHLWGSPHPSYGFKWPTMEDMHSICTEHFPEGSASIPKLETQQTFIILIKWNTDNKAKFSPCPNTDVWNYRITNVIVCIGLIWYTKKKMWSGWFKQMNTTVTTLIPHSRSLQFAVQQTCNLKVPPKINYTYYTIILYIANIRHPWNIWKNLYIYAFWEISCPISTKSQLCVIQLQISIQPCNLAAI